MSYVERGLDGRVKGRYATKQEGIAEEWLDESHPDFAPTVDQIKAALIAAVQSHLDATAAAYGYDTIYTACTYADEPAVAQFQAEGQALRAWRSLVWAFCHGVLADVMAERRVIPTADALIAALPALVYGAGHH